MNDERFWVAGDGTAHERCQLLFTSTGEAVDFDPGEHADLRWPRGGWAFYCPQCVEIWERVVMLDSRGQQRASEARSVACAQHTDQWNVPGSVLTAELEGLLSLLPPAVLKREFDVHLQWFSREQDDNSNSSRPAGQSPPNAEPDRRQGVA